MPPFSSTPDQYRQQHSHPMMLRAFYISSSLSWFISYLCLFSSSIIQYRTHTHNKHGIETYYKGRFRWEGFFFVVFPLVIQLVDRWHVGLISHWCGRKERPLLVDFRISSNNQPNKHNRVINGNCSNLVSPFCIAPHFLRVPPHFAIAPHNRNWLIWEKIPQQTVLQDQSQNLIFSDGKQPLWVHQTVLSKEVFSFWKSISQQTIHSSHQRCNSWPRFIIQISIRMEQFVWIFWRISGVLPWPFQRCCWVFAVC